MCRTLFNMFLGCLNKISSWFVRDNIRFKKIMWRIYRFECTDVIWWTSFIVMQNSWVKFDRIRNNYTYFRLSYSNYRLQLCWMLNSQPAIIQLIYFLKNLASELNIGYLLFPDGETRFFLFYYTSCVVCLMYLLEYCHPFMATSLPI